MFCLHQDASTSLSIICRYIPKLNIIHDVSITCSTFHLSFVHRMTLRHQALRGVASLVTLTVDFSLSRPIHFSSSFLRGMSDLLGRLPLRLHKVLDFTLVTPLSTFPTRLTFGCDPFRGSGPSTPQRNLGPFY